MVYIKKIGYNIAKRKSYIKFKNQWLLRGGGLSKNLSLMDRSYDEKENSMFFIALYIIRLNGV
jgi:hypothetical protein